MLVSSIRTAPFVQNKRNANTNYQSNPIISNNTNALKFYPVSFSGNNKHQALLVTVECNPYAKSGGMGAVNEDLPDEISKYAKDKALDKKFDMRIMMPFYNYDAMIRDKEDGKLYMSLVKEDRTYYSYDEFKAKKAKALAKNPKAVNIDNTFFEIKDTGIKANYKYGVKEDAAKLYKFVAPTRGVTTYLVASDEITKSDRVYDDLHAYNTKETAGEVGYGQLFDFYTDFGAASCALMDKLEKDPKNEKQFSPKTVNTTDWHTSFVINYLNQKEKNLSPEDKTRTIHTFHNSGFPYQGRIEPLKAALNLFTPEEVDIMVHDAEIQKNLLKIQRDNDIRIQIPNGKKESYNKVDIAKATLTEIAKNYNLQHYQRKSATAFNAINRRLTEIPQFGDYNWDFDAVKPDYAYSSGEMGNLSKCYNPSIYAINHCTRWGTVSEGYHNDMLNYDVFAPRLQGPLQSNRDKGFGLVNGIDIKGAWSPETPGAGRNRSKYQFSTDINRANDKGIYYYRDGKAKNKDAIFDEMNPNSGDPLQIGYLNKDYIDSPLMVLISRPDNAQKGINTAMKAVEKCMAKDPNMTVIIGGPGYNVSDGYVQDFVKNVCRKYPGRAVFYNGMIMTKKIVSGADMVLMPSNFEPCGLVQLEGMSQGAIPVVSNTGGLFDTVTDIDVDEHKKMSDVSDKINNLSVDQSFEKPEWQKKNDNVAKDMSIDAAKITSANGFKTTRSLMFDTDLEGASENFANVMNKARDVYFNEPELWSTMVRNAINHDSSWTKTAGSYYKDIYLQDGVDKKQALENEVAEVKQDKNWYTNKKYDSFKNFAIKELNKKYAQFYGPNSITLANDEMMKALGRLDENALAKLGNDYVEKMTKPEQNKE